MPHRLTRSLFFSLLHFRVNNTSDEQVDINILDLKGDAGYSMFTLGYPSTLEIIGPGTLRVKSGKFGQSAKFGQRPCLFHILIIGIK